MTKKNYHFTGRPVTLKHVWAHMRTGDKLVINDVYNDSPAEAWRTTSFFKWPGTLSVKTREYNWHTKKFDWYWVDDFYFKANKNHIVYSVEKMDSERFPGRRNDWQVNLIDPLHPNNKYQHTN